MADRKIVSQQNESQKPSSFAQAITKKVAEAEQAKKSNICPKCGSVLKESKNGWIYCPKRNWDRPAEGCQFKGYMKRQGPSQEERPTQIQPLKTASEEQVVIFQAGEELVRANIAGLQIIARAGTGKTTVLVQLARVWYQQHLTVMLLCFAKRDRIAMESKIPSHYARIKTSNGAGLSILTDYARQNKMGRIELNDKMSEQILFNRLREDGLIPPQGSKDKWQIEFKTISAVYSAVNNIRTVKLMFHPQKPTDKDFIDVLERFNVEYEPSAESTILHYAHFLFNEMASLKNMGVYGVDFTGQTFLPVYHNLLPSQVYDRVAVDECQDQNPYNRMLAFKFVDPKGGRLVAVGDEYQAIYEWRGADSDAVGELRKLMSQRGPTQTLPLTLCRRCPKLVINKYAKKLVPDIQALPDAPEGEERFLNSDEQLFNDLKERRKGLVICRANGPLVSLCLRLLAQGVPAIMTRSNIMGQLMNLIDNLTEKTDELPITDLLHKAEEWLEDQFARAAKRMDGENIARIAKDKYDCLVALSSQQELRTADQVKRKIASLFPGADEAPDAGKQILLSTVHGAKGGEAHTVYIYSPEGREFSIFDSVWSSARDRDNTLYVAVTRCAFEIVFVGPMPTFRPYAADEPTKADCVGADDVISVPKELFTETIGEDDSVEPTPGSETTKPKRRIVKGGTLKSQKRKEKE